ncbi:MAG: peptidase domain-containing ABC transporter [Rhodanobacter sp.]|nr:MAG: peptidase domain-containing ABC transporter [Rhodanobacter sp.]
MVKEWNRALGLLRFSGRKRLPTIRQNEAAECGIACLAMIAAYHGRPVSLHGLRQTAGITIRGMTLSQLIQAAGQLGFAARPLRLELEHLPELNVPCILHWEQAHFVVLKKVSPDGIVILDPAVGERFVPMRDVDRSFTGVALELLPLSEFSAQSREPKFAISQLWSRVVGLWSSAGQVLLLSAGVLLFSLLSPYFVQLVIDESISSHDLSLLNTFAIGFALLLVVQVAIATLRSLVMLVLSNQLSIQVASNLFFHLLRLPVDYFEKRHIGDIASRFVSLDRIREQITSTAIESIIDGLLVVAMLIIMWFYSNRLALIVLGSVGLYFLLKYVFFAPLRQATEEQIIAGARKDTSLIESIRAISGIKLYRREPQRMVIWQNHFAEGLNAGIRVGKITAVTTGANQLIFGLAKILVVYLAAKLIMGGQMTIGGLTAFLSYMTQFSEKAAGLVDKWQQLKLVRIHLDRVADIVLTSTEELGQAGVPSLDAASGGCHLRMEGVSFRYGVSDVDVLKGVTFEVQPGESIAIVGGSGQGKTTLLKILLGLLRPREGRVLVDGHDIWATGDAAFRGRVAAVLQDEAPLSGTVAENIAFFDEDMDMERVMKSAMAAGLHAEIMRMPMNYQSLIGDMGNALSGGQRQRLLIARALYRQPGVIVMDEATSNLDVLTERMVNLSIKSLDITRILVAHRPETIRSATRVLVLEGGEVKEVDGADLLARVDRVDVPSTSAPAAA